MSDRQRAEADCPVCARPYEATTSDAGPPWETVEYVCAEHGKVIARDFYRRPQQETRDG